RGGSTASTWRRSSRHQLQTTIDDVEDQGYQEREAEVDEHQDDDRLHGGPPVPDRRLRQRGDLGVADGDGQGGVLGQVERLVDQRRYGDPHRLGQDDEAVALEVGQRQRVGRLRLA